MSITPFYAAIFGLMFIYLSARVIGERRRLRVVLGDGGNMDLTRTIAVHANFAEYTPIALLMIVLLESVTGSGWWIHLLCLLLLAGRCIHAYGVSQVRENLKLRVTGMSMTFAVIGLTSIGILATYLTRRL